MHLEIRGYKTYTVNGCDKNHILLGFLVGFPTLDSTVVIDPEAQLNQLSTLQVSIKLRGRDACAEDRRKRLPPSRAAAA
jgi:hypothetical protein